MTIWDAMQGLLRIEQKSFDTLNLPATMITPTIIQTKCLSYIVQVHQSKHSH